ncbi:MAG TPA: tyrosine--tRNA ligase [Nitrospirae bacterium]|nr:tyrosine--tRNA ligase [bacterium BMS3Abin06]HDH10677.1 tyrosine--tRNA ligase [Nitrospirota bacterium]HDZ01493.1 tyrosine--tRNA ligase [Nitrospirota bacterium]
MQTGKPEEQLKIIKRGIVEILIEDELLQKLERSFKRNTPLKIKAGFDPTAPDIHLGHTVLLEKMRQFQDLGHKVIFIIGDFTGMIGDPTGRSEIRKPLTRDEILRNAETYKKQAFKVLDPEKTKVVFNSDWMDKMTATDLIHLAAKHTVARMMEREDFKKRYAGEQPIGIHEFIYPLIQGYDSVVLKADIELGGTDQRFNMLIGRELQKEHGQEQQVVIMMPLLEGLDGVNKMSKSLGNYIGITDSPKEMFGKIMSISDDLMLRYYELLSHISVDELNALKDALRKNSVHPMESKKSLASEIVERYHGRETAIKAKEEFENIFKKKGLPDEIPVFRLDGDAGEIWLPGLMKNAGLVKSTGEGMRLMKQGGVSLDGKKWSDPGKKLSSGEYLLKVGKRRFLKIVPQ